MAAKKNVERERLSKSFNALGNPVRLKILSLISESKRPMHIKAVAKTLKMDYAAVYRHVYVLKNANLIQIFEVGRSKVLSQLHDEARARVKDIFPTSSFS